jgi:aminoglycoside phosphotransferase (APT) family kinase protein
MDERREQPLHGGRQTIGIVRVGDTVRRPRHARSDFVHALLRHLDAAGFEGAPRPLGIDEQGREVLTYIEGETFDSTPVRLSDARLVSAARLIRRFHDATAGTALAEAQEIVAHGDLGPHNIVFDADRAVAIIDWDDYVAPGSRLVDFADAVWSCADVCQPDIPVAEQARKVQLMCDAYDWADAPAVIDEITESFQRARNRHAAEQRATAVAVFDEMLAWMQRHGPALKTGLRRS